jgi:hypothetical protein
MDKQFYQVDYMSRPDEVERSKEFRSKQEAMDFAAKMSDEHDGLAVLYDMRPNAEGIDDIVGEVEYAFGDPVSSAGTLAGVA